MRGLKHFLNNAPNSYTVSHLLQMRGLKLYFATRKVLSWVSHLLQMRGLKQNQLYTHCRPRQVASFTDAWIETWNAYLCGMLNKSHLLQMRGLKHDK